MNLYDLQQIFHCYIIFRLELLNYNGTMTNEIHIKIGGDHGGKSFKACYEICNSSSPNSTSNTVIFSFFEEKDHRVNLCTALGIFTNQIDELQDSFWR